MENAWLIGLILGAANFIPGVLLAVFHRPIGTWYSRFGLCIFYGEAFKKERRSRIFILILGVWLVVWGIIFTFLIPALVKYESQQRLENAAKPRTAINGEQQ